MLLTVFFIAGPGLKVKTLCAGITISAPVVGLRPLRSLLVRTAKLPKFLIFTFSPRSKEALMISKVALTKFVASILESPFFSEIRATISALVMTDPSKEVAPFKRRREYRSD